jgi:hypothetical protein
MVRTSRHCSNRVRLSFAKNAMMARTIASHRLVVW